MALQLSGCPVQATQHIRSSYHTRNVSSTKITSQKICTLYFRRILNFDFEQNSCTEFHKNPTDGLDGHTRSWPRIKQIYQHCYLFSSHEQATYATAAIWYLLQGYTASKMQQTDINRKLFTQSKNTPSTRQKHTQQCWSRILENVSFSEELRLC